MEKEGESALLSSLSFGFSKSNRKRVLEPSAYNEIEIEERIVEEVTDIASLKTKISKEELVLTVKSDKKWFLRKKLNMTDDKEQMSLFSRTGDDVTDTAVEELLAGALKKEDDIKLTIVEAIDNKGRQRNLELEDYEKIPIEDFGSAFLRGIGWKDETKPYEVRQRPVGLSLGANIPTRTAAYSGGNVLNEKGEELSLRPGVHCQVLNGKLEGQYGTVTGIDEDNARVFVTMSLSNEVSSLSQYSIQLVTKKLYDSEHRYINTKSVEKYKLENGEHKKRNGSEKDKGTQKHKRKHREDDAGNNQLSEDEDEIKRSKKSDKSEKEKKSSKTIDHEFLWLEPCLRVRCVDKRYKNGKYFGVKLVIIDVISRESCICRSEDGKLLEGLKQNQLETVIPKDLLSSVMVVRGSHKSQLGEIVRKDKSQCKAVIQLIPDRDEVLNIDYDSICEYVGDVE